MCVNAARAKDAQRTLAELRDATRVFVVPVSSTQAMRSCDRYREWQWSHLWSSS